MKKFNPTGKRQINAEYAISILKKHGTALDPECANLLLDFLYKFATLSVKQLSTRDSGKQTPDKMTPRKLYR